MPKTSLSAVGSYCSQPANHQVTQVDVSAVFTEYHKLLCSHANSYLGNMDAAEDVVSDVFAKFWEKREQITIDTSLKSYLYKCVTNMCIDTLRKSYFKKTVLVESFAAFDAASNNHLVSEQKELAKNIEVAVRKLPKQCAIIFRLSRENGLKYREIASALNISIKTVETQMGRAFKSIKLQYQQVYCTKQIA